MGTAVPKQFLRLGSLSVLEHSIEALWRIPGLGGLVLVSNDDAAAQALERTFAGRTLIRAAGGAQRCHSVLNGLRALQPQAHADDWVLVHDAARPCVRADDLHKLVDTLTASDDCAGGLLGVPVSDTLKRAAADRRIERTVEREGLWHAQTPQMFRLGQLTAAIETALEDGYEVTDEASAMEHCGHRPLMVEGHADNVKITRPEDLPLAELYLKQQDRL
jgi:2-C-methyl-D-erythritol 4-phosphate cytidylyltransferase